MNKQTTNANWSWEAASAICCFGGGIISGLIGSVLTALAWILGAQMHPLIRGLGTTFLILTIPLLILAGYFMDWMELHRTNRDYEERPTENKEHF